MIQCVASPLNQDYSFLTRMSEIEQTGKKRDPLIAEKIEDDLNLGLDNLIHYPAENYAYRTHL